MKKYMFLIVSVVLIYIKTHAQSVGINTNTPDSSAALDVTSTTKGVLIPRLTQEQRLAIASPAKGLLVFDSTSNSFWYRNDTGWLEIGAANKAWTLTGNSGTDTSVNFIGTTDDMPLVFKVNDSPSGMIDPDNGNTGFGSYSLFNNFKNGNIGSGNTAIGNSALFSNTNGYSNTANGNVALYYNTTGGNNTATGQQALFYNTTGTYNTAIGFSALTNNITGSYNTAGGYNALGATTTSYNTAFGAYALGATSTGDHNTAVGFFSLINNSTGINNTAVGAGALQSSTGNGNTAIGAQADVAAGLSNCTAVGNGAYVATTNQVILGNTSVTSIGGIVGWSNFSDGRFKTNIKENVPGLAFINQLKPVTYNLEIKKLNEFRGIKDTGINSMKTDYSIAEKKVRTGFIAQDVEKAARQIGYDFAGVHHPENSKDNYSLVYSDFVPSLVKAIQEQQQQIEELRKNNASLTEQNEQATAANEQLQQQLQKLVAAMSTLKKKEAMLAVHANNANAVATTGKN